MAFAMKILYSSQRSKVTSESSNFKALTIIGEVIFYNWHRIFSQHAFYIGSNWGGICLLDDETPVYSVWVSHRLGCIFTIDSRHYGLWFTSRPPALIILIWMLHWTAVKMDRMVGHLVLPKLNFCGTLNYWVHLNSYDYDDHVLVLFSLVGRLGSIDTVSFNFKITCVLTHLNRHDKGFNYSCDMISPRWYYLSSFKKKKHGAYVFAWRRIQSDGHGGTCGNPTSGRFQNERPAIRILFSFSLSLRIAGGTRLLATFESAERGSQYIFPFFAFYFSGDSSFFSIFYSVRCGQKMPILFIPNFRSTGRSFFFFSWKPRAEKGSARRTGLLSTTKYYSCRSVWSCALYRSKLWNSHFNP